MDEILKCDHANESYWAELSSYTICYTARGHSNFRSVNKIPKNDHSNERYEVELSYLDIPFQHFTKPFFENLAFPQARLIQTNHLVLNSIKYPKTEKGGELCH